MPLAWKTVSQRWKTALAPPDAESTTVTESAVASTTQAATATWARRVHRTGGLSGSVDTQPRFCPRRRTPKAAPASTTVQAAAVPTLYGRPARCSHGPASPVTV